MLVRAALRLTPRQVVFQLRRQARNVGARMVPDMYAAYIARAADRLPAVGRPDGQVMDLARRVAQYYDDEYLGQIDEIAAGRFTLFGQPADFGSPERIDWYHEVAAESDFHLWRMKLAHMGFVCPMLVSGGEQHLRAVGAVLESFRESADFGRAGCFSSTWFPYSASHRVLAVLSGYLLSLDRDDVGAALRDDIEDFLRWNVAFVLANIEHDLKNNHVERNLAAVCFYLACVPRLPHGLARRLDREVRAVMRACVLPDGMLAERSAMYQGLTVMALDVFGSTPFLSDATRSMARHAHARAMTAWRTMTHPDGEIALFNDSWFGEVPLVSDVAGEHAVQPVGLLPHAGYARLESDHVFALMDAGPIGPRWNPGHGHADFLSTELDVWGHRIVVDPGTFQYSTGPRRAFERSAQSHNGPTWSDAQPVEYSGCFRVGRMVEARMLEFKETPDGGMARGRLVMRQRDGTVERLLEVAPGLVRVTDCWLGERPGAQVRLVVPDAWRVVEHHASAVVFEHRTSAHRAQIGVVLGALESVAKGEWASGYLASESASVVTVTPSTTPDGPRRAVWELRALAQR